MTAGRILIVSNRLPVTAHAGAEGVHLAASGGGLATGLSGWHEQSDGRWIGWPGDTSRFTPAQRDDLERQLGERGIVPVFLSRDDINRYYHGFSNRVIWPLFHYLIDRVPVDATGWDAYSQVNAIFADAVAGAYRDGDTIWVHDYQLMLLPALLRARLPDARIGFFLHIPFPSSEIFRVLPWRREVLTGLLGADLIGFHTFSYLRHFVASLLHVDGVETDVDRVRTDDRDVRLGAFPMGVDAAGFAALAQSADVRADAEAIRRDAGGRRIAVGIDRLDYTKGIPRRLKAVERVLERDPARSDNLRFIQVAVPSRGEVEQYQRFKRLVEESVGRINGLFGTVGSTPVHYIHRSVSMRELVALYCAADVMLVTPLRDGMNLVAKEFVASRVDEDGVLVLSEFAGAAAELDGALVVNPYDVDALADAIQRAFAMSVEERRARMQTLRGRVTGYDVHAWARGFLEQLHAARPANRTARMLRPEPAVITAVRDAYSRGTLLLLLDYDGTLVPFARSPELAAPDDELVTLLRNLAAAPRLQMEIVSGRSRANLDAWFGDLPIALSAEHGFWHRPRHDTAWRAEASAPPDWMIRLMPILEQFTASTPGSLVEIKSASVAWHYRGAQRDFGARQGHELRMLLGDALSNQPVEVLEGKKVIEVRLRGVSKALVAQRVMAATKPDTAVVAIGDDRTHEDLFRALPATSLTVAVGRQPTRAKFCLDDFRSVRQVLRALLAEASTSLQ